ncbi:MAG: hypothetical protein E6K79_04380 [Candidatus Eisenbacteria bacterium]|uniref:Glycine zipper 2TM domain-containing protein n=1 Tax=Eiseniibacteriota bacterium TaxID=2212470 RepID=A0A538TPK9_UNCEI|nr:MAG: hypothetical protein E6K79_04380 [Candidatus Eisenbacteria bacterium]
MRQIRLFGVIFLALFLAVGLSACNKKAETDVSSTTTEGSQATASNPATTQETPSPEPSTSQPAPTTTTTTTTTTTSSKHTTKSSPSKTTKAVPAAETHTVSMPAGAAFDVQLTTPVSTKTSNVGDKIEATLIQPLVAADGQVIANKGALVRGEIAELTRASKSRAAEDRASLKLAFTSIQTVDGEKSLSTTVTNSEGKMVAGSTTKRDALVIGGSAMAGAILGKIIGKDTKGAVVGAFGGAVLGTGAMMASKGHELEVPAGSKVSLRAEEPITVVSK